MLRTDRSIFAYLLKSLFSLLSGCSGESMKAAKKEHAPSIHILYWKMFWWVLV